MKLDQEKINLEEKVQLGLVIKISMVLPGKYFALTSVFSIVFVGEVCTSRLHGSVAASPLFLGAWVLFVSFPYSMDGAPACVQKGEKRRCLTLVDLATSWLLEEMQLLSHCFLSWFRTWTELVHVVFCVQNEQSNPICLALGSERI